MRYSFVCSFASLFILGVAAKAQQTTSAPSGVSTAGTVPNVSCSRYAMRIVEPKKGVEYKLRVVKPEADVDAKMVIVPCTNETQSLAFAPPNVIAPQLDSIEAYPQRQTFSAPQFNFAPDPNLFKFNDAPPRLPFQPMPNVKPYGLFAPNFRPKR